MIDLTMPESPWVPLGDRIVTFKRRRDAKIALPDYYRDEHDRYEVIEVGKDVKEARNGDHVVFIPNAPGLRYRENGVEFFVTSEDAVVWKDSRGEPS